MQTPVYEPPIKVEHKQGRIIVSNPGSSYKITGSLNNWLTFLDNPKGPNHEFRLLQNPPIDAAQIFDSYGNYVWISNKKFGEIQARLKE
jgi:hypothetical protein